MFGPVRIAASQDIGSLGPRTGPVTIVDCPAWDSMRGAYLWILLVCLLLRRPNRSIRAWTILIPLVFIHLILRVTERNLNAYFVFYLHQDLCSTLGDLLRLFAQGTAVYLAVGDLVKARNGTLRFALSFLALFLTGAACIRHNPWPIESQPWTSWYGGFLLIFLIGHSLAGALLYRWVSPARFNRWYASFCLIFGLCPILILGGIEWWLCGPQQLASSLESMRTAIVLAGALTVPYFVWFWFAILAMRSPLYGERFEHCFGISIGRGCTTA